METETPRCAETAGAVSQDARTNIPSPPSWAAGEWNLEKWKLVSCPLLRHPSPRQPACYRHTPTIKHSSASLLLISLPPLSGLTHQLLQLGEGPTAGRR